MVPWSVAVLLLTPPLYAIIPSYSYLHTCRYIYITFRLALLHAAHNDSHTHKMQFFFVLIIRALLRLCLTVAMKNHKLILSIAFQCELT